MRFGLHTALLMPWLKTRGQGMPQLQPEAEEINGPEIFASMSWETDVDWADARLKPLVVYLRGSFHLKLPEQWREVLPKRI